MTMRSRRSAAGVFLAILLAGIGAATAQTAPGGGQGAQRAPAGAQSGAAKPADGKAAGDARPVEPEPGSTTASYGDWVLRCQRIGEGDKVARLCEVAQVIQVANQSAPIAQIAIGRVPGDTSLHLTLLTPVNLIFPNEIRVAPPAGKPMLELELRRCLPGGCFAESRVTDEQLKALSVAEGQGKIGFKDAAGQTVQLPFSPRGLQQALAGLAREK